MVQRRSYSPPSFAHWGRRVGASLIDSFLVIVVLIPAVAFALATAETTGVDAKGNDVTGVSDLGLMALMIGYAWAIGFGAWNRWVRQGRRGQSVGKSVLGIRLLSESTMQPVGTRVAFIRDICHFADGVLSIGFLWPLWDDKRQTFADKFLGTVVVVD